MKFFSNIVSRIRAVASYRWERIVLNLPFRMAMGRLGIFLMKIGRVLQVRYANWNSEFRLKHELWSSMPERCHIHVSEPVTNVNELTFETQGSQPRRITPMVTALFDIKWGEKGHFATL